MSLRSWKTAATAITEAGVLQFFTDLIAGSGVVDAIRGDFAVSPGTGLSVSIATGRAYLAASGGNAYPVINDATISNLAVTANNSGNPRYTSTVLYKNLATSANSDDTNTCHVVNVDGTPGASPSRPSDATIQSSVGAGNPFVRLADIYVANGASSLSAGNIDCTVLKEVAFRSELINQENWVKLADAATITLDFSKGKKFWIQGLTAGRTIALLNVPLHTKSFLVRITQANDGVGAHAPTWFSGISWANGGAVPTMSGANLTDEFEFNFLTVTNDSTNTSEGVTVLQNT